MDRCLLKNLLHLGELDNVAPNATFAKLSDCQVETFIKSLVVKPEDGYDAEQIKRAISDVKMSADIDDLFVSQFFEKLEGIGCGYFQEDNPKRTVALILGRVEPYALRRVMKDRILYDASFEENVRQFVKLRAAEAAACQKYTEVNTNRASTTRESTSATPADTPKPIGTKTGQSKKDTAPTKTDKVCHIHLTRLVD